VVVKETTNGYRNIRQHKELTISDDSKNKLKNGDFNSYPDLEVCSKPMNAGLWVLAILKKELGLDEEYFTSEDISNVLKLRGYPFKPIEITNAFTRIGKKIDRLKVEKIQAYMIMEPGIKHLHTLKGTNEIETIFLDGTKHWTDYNQFSKLIQKTKGDVKVLDKFYNRESLKTLSDFGRTRKIKFLTSIKSNSEDATAFSSQLAKFKHEFKNFEVKVYSKEYELHDRYIITSDFLILLGRGLQDLGGKESFVVAFKTNAVSDIKSLLESKFDERWKKSNNLK